MEDSNVIPVTPLVYLVRVPLAEDRDPKLVFSKDVPHQLQQTRVDN